MKRIHKWMGIFAAAVLMAATCAGQAAPAKKAYTFHGKVEGVNEKTKSLTVNGEEVKGWMEAMTMDYKVDDPAVLKKVKVGDQISATVYDGDDSLHKVQVMPKGAGGSKPKQ